MRLEISNFAKIKKADIRMDGITVIAGDNNTGKTTVGKVLFSVFNSVYDIANKVDVSRKRELISRCGNIIRATLLSKEREENREFGIRVSRSVEFASRELTRKISATDMFLLNADELEKIFLDVAEKYDLHVEEQSVHEFVAGVLNEIEFVNQIDDHGMAVELIERYFNSVFAGQFCNAGNDKLAEVRLTLQDKTIDFVFGANRCHIWNANNDILHEAFFVDDPFLVDKLNFRYPSEKETSNHIIAKISNTHTTDSVVNSILAKEKLKEIFDILNNVVPGGIEDKNGQWALMSEKYVEPIRFDNLSAGLKSFVLLKILLEKGILKEKDVLILDEPEIHLHPEWQIKYAEIIVLLQKKFDLSIVVTTHSRDFFEAIELFSKKYDVIDKCSFYLSRQEEGGVVFEDVSDDTARIYKHLVEPSRLLDKIKFELEEGENE